jgi:hypothetical protein
VAQHRRRRASPQQLGVIDAVPTSQQTMDQGQHLAARMGRAGTLAQVDQSISQLLDVEPLSQQGGQH